MHKFFYNYNTLTERYELSLNKGLIFNARSMSTANTTLLKNIQDNLQKLYQAIVSAKERETDEERLKIFDETELMISNLYYSLFASPLELVSTSAEENNTNYLNIALSLITALEQEINIPEYNRLATLIKNNIFQMNNS